MLPSEIRYLSTECELHVIDIPEIDGNLEALLDKYLVSICEGDSDSELGLVKLRLRNFFEDKRKNTTMGAIAEFLVHLYLNQNGFKQEFLFFNLEEGSIKKGFDGFFSKGSETYLLESKSGSVISKNVSHKEKLRSAYSDLDNYVSGKSDKGKNNPWKNAYNHASHMDVGTEKSIRKKIKRLQDNFDMGKFSDINDFNVIPCSTIFLDGIWSDGMTSEILLDHEFVSKFSGNTVKAICITKDSVDIFFNYLSK
ncbi:hypothetical protein [Vibrio parahaemolyticus]|jgi:hypothetical protein|uniref:hypothetical protein n=1 Tax=Vibrio parahaemolyticus TaxID=670 RepID=UPI0021D8E6BD|nr:hypothetical protein [Vibrio parahaemolyticus]EIV8491873.1 hypothetical protein [Vibrio vulnificus]MCU8141417.1 hypothetical protein [Vibrio vulnificus]HCG7921273.1 hypothetical protein [Vibrio parahaemolyticus]